MNKGSLGIVAEDDENKEEFCCNISKWDFKMSGK